MEHFRVMALLQAMRAQRGSAHLIAGISSPRVRALYLILEAQACDETLAALLPGVAASITRLRLWCLAKRPAITSLPAACQPTEHSAQAIIECTVGPAVPDIPACPDPHGSLVSPTPRR